MPARHRNGLVGATVTLLRKRGYARTRVADISALAGAPLGSLYHFFPGGKTAIAAAAVREAGLRVERTLDELASAVDSTPALLLAHARLISGWLAASGYRDGCPITSVLLELAPAEGAVAAAGRDAYQRRLDVLRRRLAADGFCEDRAAELAVLCTSAIQGAIIQSRMVRSDRPLLTTASALGVLLRNALHAA